MKRLDRNTRCDMWDRLVQSTHKQPPSAYRIARIKRTQSESLEHHNPSARRAGNSVACDQRGTTSVSPKTDPPGRGNPGQVDKGGQGRTVPNASCSTTAAISRKISFAIVRVCPL